MIFQVVSPITMTIDGDSFKDAVKNFAKLNYDLNLSSIILTDQARYMKANLNYYRRENKDKVGISLLPTVWPLGSMGLGDAGFGLNALAPLAVKSDGEILSPLNMWPYSPTISYDTKEYEASTFLNVPPFVPRVVSVGPVLGSLVDPLGSLTNPLVGSINPFGFPTVFNYGSKIGGGGILAQQHADKNFDYFEQKDNKELRDQVLAELEKRLSQHERFTEPELKVYYSALDGKYYRNRLCDSHYTTCPADAASTVVLAKRLAQESQNKEALNKYAKNIAEHVNKSGGGWY
jgi:hypothetical protein